MGHADYNPEWVEHYFDDFGENEWERLTRSPGREVQLHVHIQVLREVIGAGDRVLEIGAGAGRFTLSLDEIGAVVTVADISQVQLDLNQQNAKAFGFASRVDGWHKADICAMPEFADETYDAVVCIGGPLSYVLDRRDAALAECIRVVKPGGAIVVGVMSLWGTIHQYLGGVLEFSEAENQKITESGDLTAANSQMATHFCHLFRSEELRALLIGAGLGVEFLSASSCLSAVHESVLVEARNDEVKWRQLLDMEVKASREPGFLDGGTHLIAVARKPSLV